MKDYKKLWMCMMAFAMNVALVGLVRIAYWWRPPKALFPNKLSVQVILTAGLAGACMMHYLIRTRTFVLRSTWLRLVGTIAYGCCAYLMMQENSVWSYLIFLTFPIVFLSWEAMLYDNKHMAFIFVCAVMLALSPEAGIPVLLFLYCLTLVELVIRKQFNLGEWVHTTVCFLMSFCLAGFRTMYYLAPNFADHADYAYEGYQSVYGLTGFLARFMPGAVSSNYFLGLQHRMDLYVGLLILAFTIAFFFDQRVSLNRRIWYLFFTVLVVLALDLSPLRLIFALGYNKPAATAPEAFFLCFWLVRLAMLELAASDESRREQEGHDTMDESGEKQEEHGDTDESRREQVELIVTNESMEQQEESISYLKQFGRLSGILACILWGLWIAVSWLFYRHNMLDWFLGVDAGFFLIYFLINLATRRRYGKGSAFFLMLMLLFEIGASAYITTNTEMIPEQLSVAPQFILTEQPKQTKEKVQSRKDSGDQNDQADIFSKSSFLKKEKHVILICDYVGVGLSLLNIGILVILCFYDDKEKIYAVLLRWKNNISLMTSSKIVKDNK